MGTICKELGFPPACWWWIYKVIELTCWLSSWCLTWKWVQDMKWSFMHARSSLPAVKLHNVSFCRIQPVYVIDVAAAIVNSLKDDGTSMGKIYELGGPEIYTVHELVTVTPTLSWWIYFNLHMWRKRRCDRDWLWQAELMYETIREWPRYVNVPLPVARVWI